MRRGTYNDGRSPTSYPSGAGYTDDRNVTSYGEDGYSDHVCRPVIVDAAGRKRPIISYGSPNAGQESYGTTRTERPIISFTSPNAGQESYVATRTATIVGTERIVEPVVVTRYNTYSSQATVGPLKEYGAANDKWSNPSNKVYDRSEYGYNPPSKMEPVRNYGVDGDRPKYRYNSPPKMEPARNYGGAGDRAEYGYNSPSKMEPVRNHGVAGDRPEYGYNSPSKMEPARNYGVDNSPSKMEPARNYGVAGDRPEYGYNSPSKMEPARNYGVAGDRPEYGYNSPTKMEPVRNYGSPNDNWRGSSLNGGQDRQQKVQPEVSRPTRPGLLSPNLWRNQPNNNDKKKLSSPISDIGTALEVLKDAAKPSSIATAAIQSQLPAVLASAIGPKRDGYSETIDSREAGKRYGNLNLASRPYQAGETYTGTIDSREAAQRYGGATV